MRIVREVWEFLVCVSTRVGNGHFGLIAAGTAVTLDLNARFTGQVKGGVVVTESRIAASGRNIFFSRTEIRDEAGALVAYGGATHRWRAGSETVDGLAGLDPKDEPAFFRDVGEFLFNSR